MIKIKTDKYVRDASGIYMRVHTEIQYYLWILETPRFSLRDATKYRSRSLFISRGSPSNRLPLIPVDSPNAKGNRQPVQLIQFRTGCIIV